MNENNNNSMMLEEESSFNFKLLWRLFIVNWYWFIISIVLCLFVTGIYLWFTPTTVSVIGKIQLIDKSKKGSGVSASLAMLNSLPMGIGSSLSGAAGAGAIDSEKEILMSTILVRNVVEDLELYTEYRLCKWGKKTLLYQDNPVNVSIDSLHLKWFEDELPLNVHQIELNITKDSKGYYLESPLFEENKNIGIPSQPFSSLPVTIKTELGILTLSDNYLTPQQAKKYENGYTLKVTIIPPTIAANSFIGRLTAEPPSKKVMNILNITLQDENLMRGIDFVNHLVDAYNQRANNEKNEEARKTEEFVNTRLAKIDQELGSSDAAWENSKKNFQITTPEVDAEEVMGKKSLYETQLVAVGTELQLHDYLSDFVNDPSNIFEIIPAGLSSGTGAGSDAGSNMSSGGSAGTTSLLAQHNTLVNQRRDLLKSVSEMSPQVQRISQSIKELQPAILTAMKRDRQSIIVRQNTLQREYSKYMGRVGNAPKMERILTEIGRERSIKQGVYLVMLQKREETAMDLANTSDKGKLIDETKLKPGSSSPQKARILLLALLIGSLLPLGLFYLLQILRTKIDQKSDLEAISNLPFLGGIPISGDEDAIRTIRTNLLFNLNDCQKTILITSISEGDGKSFVAKNLAESLNAIGKKTSLIDGNLRNKVSGTHPADILASDTFAKQIAQNKEANDYVLIDSPALGKYTDAQQLAQFVDATIIVIKAESTDRSEIEPLNNSNLPHIMLVLNLIDTNSKQYKIKK